MLVIIAMINYLLIIQPKKYLLLTYIICQFQSINLLMLVKCIIIL